MKKQDSQELTKKLVLNKNTIATLTKDEQKDIKAGYKACWENLWTWYWCEYLWTGNKPEETDGVCTEMIAVDNDRGMSNGNGCAK